MTTIQEEAEFERKAEKMLRGHREVPNGRNFLAWVMRYHASTDDFCKRYDDTFDAPPLSEDWWDDRFCQKCDKPRGWCECKH